MHSLAFYAQANLRFLASIIMTLMPTCLFQISLWTESTHQHLYACISSSPKQTPFGKVLTFTWVEPTSTSAQYKQSFLISQCGTPTQAQCLFSPIAGCSELDKILGKLNLQTHQYNTHSFRIRAATSAKHTGMSDVLIKTLGQWQSDAYQRYIRTSHNNWPTYQGYCYLRHQDKQPDTLDKYKTLG